jgi:hypothetical protein
MDEGELCLNACDPFSPLAGRDIIKGRGMNSMKKIAVVSCVVFSFAAAAFSQTARRTVTNADLAKFESRRVEAERQYSETYAQKGMLSPDELKARNDARVKETLELAEQIRQADLERTRLQLEANAQALQAQQIIDAQNAPVYAPYDNSIWSYGYFTDGFGRRFRGRFPVARNQGWYAAGGNVWLAPLGTRSQRLQPAFRITRSIGGGGGRRH